MLRSYFIAPALLGRLYLRPREYMSELKALVKATGYRKIPVELREVTKEQAWEKVHEQEVATRTWVIR